MKREGSINKKKLAKRWTGYKGIRAKGVRPRKNVDYKSL